MSVARFARSLILFLVSTTTVVAVAPPAEHTVRRIRYSFTITNDRNVMAPEAVLHLFAPIEQGARQKAVKIDATYDFETIVDERGNKLLRFKVKAIPPLGKRVIFVRTSVDLEKSPRKEVAGKLAAYLEPEPFIQCDDPKIVAKARQLNRASAKETLGALYRFVGNHLSKSHYEHAIKGACWALKHEKGDCTEHACLLAALCRAAGIHARVVGGFVLERDGVLLPGGYHDWVEVFVDGAWRVADAHRKKLMEEEQDYIVFRVLHGDNGPVTGLRRYHLHGQGLSGHLGSRMQERLANNLRPRGVSGACGSCR